MATFSLLTCSELASIEIGQAIFPAPGWAQGAVWYSRHGRRLRIEEGDQLANILERHDKAINDANRIAEMRWDFLANALTLVTSRRDNLC
jgi:hypothetical protein